MKNVYLVGLLSFCFLFANIAKAQLSKDERKEWKKKAKEYKKNPEQLKSLVEENSALGSQVSSLKNQVNSLQSNLDDETAKVSELQDQIESLRGQIAAKNQQISELKTKDVTQHKGQPSEKGLVFKVQIGAFQKDKKLTEYAEDQKNFDEDTAEGMHKYTLGTFRDYWEADKFKKRLRQMGVQEAWIVAYKDGQRVPIKDVLEGIIQG